MVVDESPKEEDGKEGDPPAQEHRSWNPVPDADAAGHKGIGVSQDEAVLVGLIVTSREERKIIAGSFFKEAPFVAHPWL